MPPPIKIPLSYEAVVEEICRFTDLPVAEVQRRVWAGALVPGCNIVDEVPRFGVTPHHYDEHMVRLYTQADAFIYDGLVYWNEPFRRSWSQLALERLQQYAHLHGLPLGEMRILMFGDGTGNDSLFLISHGFRVDYFDVPGSRTYEFACKRFNYYGVVPDSVRLISDYAQVPADYYDAVISFEVLEHLPDSRAAIRDIARFLKTGGIALVTEAFSGVTSALPTHLAANRRLSGRTPFLFWRAGLDLTWYARLFKPMEFTKRPGAASRAYWQLLRDKTVVVAFMKARWQSFKAAIRYDAL